MFTIMRSENFYYFHQDCSKSLAEYWRMYYYHRRELILMKLNDMFPGVFK